MNVLCLCWNINKFIFGRETFLWLRLWNLELKEHNEHDAMYAERILMLRLTFTEYVATLCSRSIIFVIDSHRLSLCVCFVYLFILIYWIDCYLLRSHSLYCDVIQMLSINVVLSGRFNGSDTLLFFRFRIFLFVSAANRRCVFLATNYALSVFDHCLWRAFFSMLITHH